MKRPLRPTWLKRWQKAYYVAFALSLLLGGPSLSEENVPEPALEADDTFSAVDPVEEQAADTATQAGTSPAIEAQPAPEAESALGATIPLTAPFPGMGVPLRTSTPPPAYLSAPHPLRAEVGDVRRLLQQAGPEEMTLAEECANELEAKPSRQEAEKSVRTNPLKYHWCFYHMVLGLEDTVRSTTDYLQRKQTVIATYSRLVVVAQAFKSVFKDRRYVEFAAEHYRQINEYLFSRRLVASKDRKQETQSDRIANPFPGYRPISEPGSVLGKYGIRPEPFLSGVIRGPAAAAPASADPR